MPYGFFSTKSSMLTEAERLGDVDIAIELLPKPVAALIPAGQSS
jgi:hypothetical protein